MTNDGMENVVIVETEDISNLIPTSDKEAWLLNYKHNWIYNTTRLFDIQNIDYSPFITESTKGCIKIFNLDELVFSSPVYEEIGFSDKGYIYIDYDLNNDHLVTDVVALKGEIKWISHHTSFNNGHKLLSDVRGKLELKFAGIIAAHFKKYTGIINFFTVGDIIVKCSLKPSFYMIPEYGQDWIKKVNKLYARKTWGKK